MPILLLNLTGNVRGLDLIDQFYETFGLESVENAGTAAFPILEMPSGGRRDAMGGAYTAVPDIAGFAEANPATSTSHAGSSLNLGHQDWFADSSIETLSYVWSSSILGLGAAAKYFRVPFTAYDDMGTRTGAGYFSEGVVSLNLAMQFLTLNRLTIAAGANVKTVFRVVTPEIADGQWAFSIPVDFGILSRFRLFSLSGGTRDSPGYRNMAVGAAIRNVGQTNQQLDARLPTVVTAGVSYSPIRAILLSGDVYVPISFNPTDDPAEPLYGAAGVSVAAGRFFDIQAGVRIRRGDYRVSLGTTLHVGPLDISTNYIVGPVAGIGPQDSISAEIALRRER